MLYKTFKILLFFIVFTLISLIFGKALAQQKVTVGAPIDSRVSNIQSKIETNATETLADPTGHSILLTITLRDADGKPMPNIPVTVTSNRGQVDVIEAISKISYKKSNLSFLSVAHALESSDLNKGVTDSNGQVQFRVTSFIAGEAVFTVLADSLVILDPIKIKYDPLPFPTDVTISMTNPITGKQIELYSPKRINQGLSGAQIQAQKLVNTGTRIQLSFWIFAVPIFLIFLCSFFIILNFINLRRMRRMEKEQLMLLKKIFPSNYNRQS